MATLYEIDSAILDCITEDGEIIDAEMLQALQLERAQKIENVALWYKNLLSDAEQYKAEKEVFAQREKQAKNKADSLKQWLENALQGEKYKSARVNITYRKSEQVVIADGCKLPDEYLRYSDPEPDKTALKQALKDGEMIEGVQLLNKQNISIK